MQTIAGDTIIRDLAIIPLRVTGWIVCSVPNIDPVRPDWSKNDVMACNVSGGAMAPDPVQPNSSRRAAES